MSRAVRIILVIFACLYAVALLVLAVGTSGWLGQDKDPLSAAFLIPLGLPWNLVGGGWLAAVLAPAFNLLIVAAFGLFFARRKT